MIFGRKSKKGQQWGEERFGHSGRDDFSAFDNSEIYFGKKRTSGFSRFFKVRKPILLMAFVVILLMATLAYFNPEALENVKKLPSYLSLNSLQNNPTQDQKQALDNNEKVPQYHYEIVLHSDAVIYVNKVKVDKEVLVYETAGGLVIRLNRSEVKSLRKLAR